MFKFMRLGKDLYRVYHRDMGIDTQGTLADMTEVLRAIGVEQDEVNLALDAIFSNGHNCADFGSDPFGPHFIFSEQIEVGSAGYRLPTLLAALRGAA